MFQGFFVALFYCFLNEEVCFATIIFNLIHWHSITNKIQIWNVSQRFFRFYFKFLNNFFSSFLFKFRWNLYWRRSSTLFEKIAPWPQDVRKLPLAGPMTSRYRKTTWPSPMATAKRMHTITMIDRTLRFPITTVGRMD